MMVMMVAMVTAYLALPLHPADLLFHQQLQESLRAQALRSSFPIGQDPHRVPVTGRHAAAWLAAHSRQASADWLLSPVRPRLIG